MKWILITITLAHALAQKPDNSKMNQRDQKMDAVTAETQSNTKPDLDLTRNIRRQITMSKSMSTNGKNIKIITRDGGVTLRGPVKDEEEKRQIDGIAKKLAGDSKVNNLLEPTPKN